MTKLETINFDNKEKFSQAMFAVLAGEDVFRSYQKNGETKKLKIISNNRLYLGNNYSLSINEAKDGKVYLSIDYFSAEDRIRMSKDSQETTKEL